MLLSTSCMSALSTRLLWKTCWNSSSGYFWIEITTVCFACLLVWMSFATCVLLNTWQPLGRTQEDVQYLRPRWHSHGALLGWDSCLLHELLSFFPSSPQSPGWILGLSELPDLPRGCLVAHTGLLGEHMKKGKFEKQKHISCDLFFLF